MRILQLLFAITIMTYLGACAGPKPGNSNDRAGDNQSAPTVAERAGVVDEAVDASEWNGWIIGVGDQIPSPNQEERGAAMARAYQWPDTQPLSVSIFFWLGVVATLAYILSRVQHRYRTHH